MISFLLACAAEPIDGDSADAIEATHDATTGYHLLISGQMVLANEDAPGVYEVDEHGEMTWNAPLELGTGGFGAARADGHETLIAWTQIGTTLTSGLLRADRDGNTLSRYDEGSAENLSFPHGIAHHSAGQIVVGDGWSGDILAIDSHGDIVWRLATPDLGFGQVPSGLRVFQVGGRPLLIATLLGEGPLDSGMRYDQVVAWWIDGSSPQLAWAFPPEPDSSSVLWVHGPQQMADGSFLVSSAGLGQIVHIDAEGNELERLPPSDDPYRFAFPRDAVETPDGDLLVLDATELLLVRDPFGDYTVEPVRELLFGYSVDLLDCTLGTCIGGDAE